MHALSTRKTAVATFLSIALAACVWIAPVRERPAGAWYDNFMGLSPAEIIYCAASAQRVAACALTDVARDQSINDMHGWYQGADRDDDRKGNAFLHAWWTVLTAALTSRDFAWEITSRHETGYSGWETDPKRQMDLHNDRVGYHLADGLEAGGQALSLLEGITAGKADNSILDEDGVNGDYSRLIRRK